MFVSLDVWWFHMCVFVCVCVCLCVCARVCACVYMYVDGVRVRLCLHVFGSLCVVFHLNIEEFISSTPSERHLYAGSVFFPPTALAYVRLAFCLFIYLFMLL